MQNSVEGLLEVYEDIGRGLLVLDMFFTKDSWVEDLLCVVPSCSETCLFFWDDLLRLRLKSVQYDLQHDIALTADEADSSVVLALFLVAFLGKCDDRGQGPWRWPFSCLQVLLADCCESSDSSFSTCLDQFCWDVVNSS